MRKLTDQPITLADVWTWMCAGCNTAEIAAYAGVETDTARAWMDSARKKYRKQPCEQLVEAA